AGADAAAPESAAASLCGGTGEKVLLRGTTSTPRNNLSERRATSKMSPTARRSAYTLHEPLIKLFAPPSHFMTRPSKGILTMADKRASPEAASSRLTFRLSRDQVASA